MDNENWVQNSVLYLVSSSQPAEESWDTIHTIPHSIGTEGMYRLKIRMGLGLKSYYVDPQFKLRVLSLEGELFNHQSAVPEFL